MSETRVVLTWAALLMTVTLAALPARADSPWSGDAEETSWLTSAASAQPAEFTHCFWPGEAPISMTEPGGNRRVPEALPGIPCIQSYFIGTHPLPGGPHKEP